MIAYTFIVTWKDSVYDTAVDVPGDVCSDEPLVVLEALVRKLATNDHNSALSTKLPRSRNQMTTTDTPKPSRRQCTDI